MLRAVIFDFDGVITDSEILHLRAFNHVLGRFGFQITKEDYYQSYLGFTDVDCFKALADDGKIHLGDGVLEELIERKNRVFVEFDAHQSRILLERIAYLFYGAELGHGFTIATDPNIFSLFFEKPQQGR